MSSPARPPVAFEIYFKDNASPTRHVPFRERLESSESATPTLQEIEQKLSRAEEKRQARLAVRKARTDEKVNQFLERKNAHDQLITAKSSQKHKELVFKLETAESLRSRAIETRISVAKKSSQLLGKAQQTRQEIADDKKTRTLERLEKKAQAQVKSLQLQQQMSQKAKDHFEHVSQAVQIVKERQALTAEQKKQNLELRQLRARAIRGEKLLKVKFTAQLSQVRGRSHSTEVAPQPLE